MDQFIDTAQKILAIILPLLAALPGLLALNRQKQAAEAKKIDAEADKVEAEASDQIAKTALDMIKHHEEDTQRSRIEADNYRKMVEELRSEFKGCKDQLTTISSEMAKALTENANLRREVKALREIVSNLTDQLRQLGIKPKFGDRSEDLEILEEI